MTYEQALDYIHGTNRSFCKPGLDRIETLCKALGNPEKDLNCIHVAGTNGKGSFCAMTASILQAAGYKVGLYISPYIRRFNERMQINGEPISDAELISLTETVRPIADDMADTPTEFEIITAMAFAYFKRHDCDIVVLETGLGGRLDSTNVIPHPLLSVITGIALDHTAILGDTIEQIASEKAGIIKAGAPVLYGGADDTAAAVIETVAGERQAPYRRVDYTPLTVQETSLSGTVFDYDKWDNISLPLLGTYQPYNAAIVLNTVEILRENGWNIPTHAVCKGLQNTVWHARFEVVSRDPLIIFDGAHNPQGITAAVDSIKTYFGEQRVCLLTGVLQDKDYTDIAAILSTVADRAFTFTPDSPRALEATRYAAVLQEAGLDAQSYTDIATAFFAAKAAATADKKPLVCLGSLYAYVSLLPLFEQ